MPLTDSHKLRFLADWVDALQAGRITDPGKAWDGSTEVQDDLRRIAASIDQRRIVQIAACGVDEKQSTQCELYLFALCNDGTLWFTDNRDIHRDYPPDVWNRMAAIPQDDCPTVPPELNAEQVAPGVFVPHGTGGNNW